METNIIGIFLSPRGIINSAKNYLTETKFELDLGILMTNLYIEFQSKMSICDGDNKWKPIIIGFFSVQRSYIWTRTKFELDLRILMTHLYTKFLFKMSFCDGEYWRKLKISGNFLNIKGYFSTKDYSTGPKFNVVLQVLMKNLCTKFHLKMSMYDRDNERKLNPE